MGTSIVAKKSQSSNSLTTLAAKINEHHAAAISAASSAIEHARQAGLLLLEAKAKCEHGEWSGWLKDNFAATDRTARNYMRVAGEWDTIEAKRKCSSDLSIAGALRLLSGPKDDGDALTSAERSRLAELEGVVEAGLAKMKIVDDACDAIAKASGEPLAAVRARYGLPAIEAVEPFPELQGDETIECVGVDGRMAIIIPVGDGYFYVGVAAADHSYIDEIARGLIGWAVRDYIFETCEFTPAGSWQRRPESDFDRTLVSDGRDADTARWLGKSKEEIQRDSAERAKNVSRVPSSVARL